MRFSLKSNLKYSQILNILKPLDQYFLSVLYIGCNLSPKNYKNKSYYFLFHSQLLLIATWAVGICFDATVSLTLHSQKKPHEFAEKFFTYFYIILDLTFLVVASVSYIIMFRIYKRTRDIPVQPYANNPSNPPERTSSFEIFMNSRFTVSALLVLNFFLLVVVPDLVVLVHHLLRINEVRFSHLLYTLARYTVTLLYRCTFYHYTVARFTVTLLYRCTF